MAQGNAGKVIGTSRRLALFVASLYLFFAFPIENQANLESSGIELTLRIPAIVATMVEQSAE